MISSIARVTLVSLMVASCMDTPASTSGKTCELPASFQGSFQTAQGAFTTSFAVLDGDALIGGDMLMPLSSYDYASATATGSTKWLNNQVPYNVPDTFARKEDAERAINEWNAVSSQTGIRFVPRTSETDYIEFTSEKEGCFTYVGRRGGRQLVNIENSAKCPYVAYLHELGHTVNLVHEHQRPDRDFYIEVRKENLRAEIVDSWEPMLGLHVVTGYDVGSLMHYSAGAGADKCQVAADGKKSCAAVMVARDRNVSLGMIGGKTIQPSDIAGVASLYGGTGPTGGVPSLPGDERLGDNGCFF